MEIENMSMIAFERNEKIDFVVASIQKLNTLFR